MNSVLMLYILTEVQSYLKELLQSCDAVKNIGKFPAGVFSYINWIEWIWFVN